MGADDDFADFFGLSQLYVSVIKSHDYAPSEELVSGLTFAPYGESIYERMRKAHSNLGEAELLTAMIEEMWWEDLFFSPTQVNLRALEAELQRAFQSGSIRAPWMYGGVLYRKANSLFDYIAEKLDQAETWSLLSGTPQGVYQYRAFVSGPLGLLKSQQLRDLKMYRTVPLSHCSDPSCTAIHPARLTDRGDRAEASRMLRTLLEMDTDGSRALFERYNRLDGETEYYDDRNPASIPPFIGDSFDAIELRSILEDLLAQPKGLRSQLASSGIAKRLSGSGTEIASRFSEAECLQVILLQSDLNVVASVDRLIEKGAIRIPASEIRSAKLAPGSARGWHNVRCEASCYGIRLVSPRGGVPLARLKRLINDVSEADHNNSDLAWKLRYTAGDTVEQKLDNYLNDHTPEDALLEHVFSTPAALEKAFDLLRYGHFQLPATAEEERGLVKRMMWKLGFDVPAHPLHYRRITETIDSLRAINAKHLSRSGDVLHRIRGEAANLFVELERLLGQALAFSCWMLTSDHYKHTRFSYDIGLSNQEMAEKLNKYQEESAVDPRIAYDRNGKNTLFPLINGFRLLADYCRQLQTEARRFERPKEEYPGFAGHDRIAIFPFKHTKLILDVSENVRTTVLSDLAGITANLENLKAAGIRNRIEHNRDDFPDQREIASLLEGLSLLVERMQSTGLAPVSYIRSGRRVDRWGRGYDEFENYRGEVLCIPSRAELDPCGLPSGRGYLVIAPSIKIGNTEEVARFLIKEPSRYEELWKGYPIKRLKGQDGSQEAETLLPGSDNVETTGDLGLC